MLLPPRQLSAPSPVVVSPTGKKQVISLTPHIYDYLLSHTREPPILRELREETSMMRGHQMQVSPEQAQLLAMLLRVTCFVPGAAPDLTRYDALLRSLNLWDFLHLNLPADLLRPVLVVPLIAGYNPIKCCNELSHQLRGSI